MSFRDEPCFRTGKQPLKEGDIAYHGFLADTYLGSFLPFW
jgi:hypothetical protein